MLDSTPRTAIVQLNQNLKALACFCININKRLSYKCCKYPLFSFIDHHFINRGILLKGNYLKSCPSERPTVNTDTRGSYPNRFNSTTPAKSNVSPPRGQTKSNPEQASKILEFDWFSKI